jgi:hypothetical protein
MVDYNRIALLFALISLALAIDLAAIKPRFPQKFMATITHNQDYNGQSYYGGQPYPCLFDFINKREKCGNRIRNFLNNTFTETNLTMTFPPKCNMSSININNAKLLDPNWFDKLNLSLTSVSHSRYTWLFTLKSQHYWKNSLLHQRILSSKMTESVSRSIRLGILSEGFTPQIPISLGQNQ